MNNVPDKNKFSLKQIGIEKLILLLIAGVFLLVVSKTLTKDSKVLKEELNQPSLQTVKQVQDQEISYVKKLEDKLQRILSKVEGVGKVEVMITLKGSKELVVNKDKPTTIHSTEEKDSEGGERSNQENHYEEKTVLMNNNEGAMPFVVKEIEPEVGGIVIIAEGGEQPIVKNNLTKAAEVLFDIPAHKIKVMKMVTH